VQKGEVSSVFLANPEGKEGEEWIYSGLGLFQDLTDNKEKSAMQNTHTRKVKTKIHRDQKKRHC
jgi:hypothetical protein